MSHYLLDDPRAYIQTEQRICEILKLFEIIQECSKTQNYVDLYVI